MAKPKKQNHPKIIQFGHSPDDGALMALDDQGRIWERSTNDATLGEWFEVAGPWTRLGEDEDADKDEGDGLTDAPPIETPEGPCCPDCTLDGKPWVLMWLEATQSYYCRNCRREWTKLSDEDPDSKKSMGDAHRRQQQCNHSLKKTRPWNGPKI